MKKHLIVLFLIILLSAALRLYHLGSNPPSLYWDEPSLGYNAYSISQTLRDEHNEFLPIARFIAFGDYKAPAYIYSDVPFILMLGPTEFAIRLPSAISGILIVISAYFLCLELFARSSNRKKIGLLASLVVAISPWTLQLSRAAFEANLATAVMSLGILFLLKFIHKPKLLNLILSVTLLALTFYSFNSHRVFIPFFIVFVGLLNFKSIWKFRLKSLIWLILMAVLLLPMVPYLLSPESRLRFQEVAWINDSAPITLSNSRTEQDGGGLIPKLLHNRRIVYLQEFLLHYTDNFRSDFLFFSGDENHKLSIQKFGELHLFDLIPFLFGLIFLLRKHNKASALIFGWYLLGIIPASTARETPHALRISPSLPMPQIIVGLGIFEIAKYLHKFKYWKYLSLSTIFSVLLFLTVSIYGQYYWKWYPQNNSLDWQYGYKQMVQTVLVKLPSYKGVVVTESYGRPYIYFLLYGGPMTPQFYFENGKSERDWFGLWTVHSIGNIYFGDYDKSDSGWLYVRPKGKSPLGSKIVQTVSDLKGDTVFEISAK